MAAAVPAGPPPTTTTSGRGLLRDGEEAVRPAALDAHRRHARGREGRSQLGLAEGAAYRDEAVLDADARLEQEWEDGLAEHVGHARAAQAVHDESPPRQDVEPATQIGQLGLAAAVPQHRPRPHTPAPAPPR